RVERGRGRQVGLVAQHDQHLGLPSAGGVRADPRRHAARRVVGGGREGGQQDEAGAGKDAEGHARAPGKKKVRRIASPSGSRKARPARRLLKKSRRASALSPDNRNMSNRKRSTG